MAPSQWSLFPQVWKWLTETFPNLGFPFCWFERVAFLLSIAIFLVSQIMICHSDVDTELDFSLLVGAYLFVVINVFGPLENPQGRELLRDVNGSCAEATD